MEEDLLAERCLMDLTRVDAVGLMDTGLMELSGGGRLEPLPNGGEGTNDRENFDPSIHCTMHTLQIHLYTTQYTAHFTLILNHSLHYDSES